MAKLSPRCGGSGSQSMPRSPDFILYPSHLAFWAFFSPCRLLPVGSGLNLIPLWGCQGRTGGNCLWDRLTSVYNIPSVMR